MKFIATIIAVFSLLWGGCSETTEDFEPAPSVVPGLILAEISLDPPVATAGATVRVEVRLAGAREASLSISLPGQDPVAMPAPSQKDGLLVSVLDVTMLARTGDQLITVEGTSDAGNVNGFKMFTATAGTTCAAGQVFESGLCVARSEGHVLQVDAVATIGNMAALSLDDARNMQHPRSVHRVGNALVGCHTDHIGIVQYAAFEQMEVLLNEDLFDPLLEEEDDDGDGFTPVTETLLDVAGLKHCEALVLNDDKTLAVSSSRGTFGEDGGLAVWRIPDLSGPPPWAEPEFISAEYSVDGFEGIAFRDGVIYAALKPNRVATFALSSDGKLTLLADVVVPEMLSAWDIELAGDRLFISDPGMHSATATVTAGPADGQFHYGHPHQGGAGRFFVLDIADASDPQPLGWASTKGGAKGMAALGSTHLAVASGSAGFEIFDVTNPELPVAVAREDTPGTANDVFFRDGYLGVADWDAVRLYDVTEPQQPRFLEANDIGIMAVLESKWEAEVTAEGDEFILSSGTIAMAYVTITEDLEWFATDLDRIIGGRIRPGHRAPRINLHDKRRSVRVGAQADPSTAWALKFTNAGIETLWVRVQETDTVTSPDGTLAVAPGETAVIEAVLTGLNSANPPDRVSLLTNDPETPVRETRVLGVTNQYGLGDPAPTIHLTSTNRCVDGECDMSKACMDTSDEIYAGKPIFFAFFSSW